MQRTQTKNARSLSPVHTKSHLTVFRRLCVCVCPQYRRHRLRIVGPFRWCHQHITRPVPRSTHAFNPRPRTPSLGIGKALGAWSHAHSKLNSGVILCEFINYPCAGCAGAHSLSLSRCVLYYAWAPVRKRNQISIARRMDRRPSDRSTDRPTAAAPNRSETHRRNLWSNIRQSMFSDGIRAFVCERVWVCVCVM